MTEELFIEKEFSKIDFFTDRIVKVHGADCVAKFSWPCFYAII